MSLLATLAVACDLPRDPRKSLERAKRVALRVGVSENAPWVIKTADEPSGVEVDLVRAFASRIGAKLDWVWGMTDDALDRLSHYELDVVIAGLTASSPWKKKIGFTRPYFVDSASKEEHVMAVAPGENALLTELERFLKTEEASVAERLVRARTG